MVDPAFAGSDTLATARALALGLRRESFDLVLCGKSSVDAETGQVSGYIKPPARGEWRMAVSSTGGQGYAAAESEFAYFTVK